MISSLLSQYTRTFAVLLILLLVVLVEAFDVRSLVYGGLLPVFEWLKYSSWIGIIGTTYGSVYATVEAVHLLAMGTIGGLVLATDLRLLGVLLRDIPSETVSRGTYKAFKIALIVAVLSGIFCAAGVGDKVYYMTVFWVKMLVLLAGAGFMFYIKQPLLNSKPHSEINPWLMRLLAITSMLIWFTVAATGRWIGFS